MAEEAAFSNENTTVDETADLGGIERETKRQRLLTEQDMLYRMAIADDAHLRPPAPPLHDTHPDRFPLRITFPVGITLTHNFHRMSSAEDVIHFARHHMRLSRAAGSILLRTTNMQQGHLSTTPVPDTNDQPLHLVFHPRERIHIQLVPSTEPGVSGFQR